MKNVLEWWRGRKWVYLGQTGLNIVYTNKTTNEEVDQKECFVHFYAWQNNMKKRKYKYGGPDSSTFEKDPWFHKHMMPWLEGGDMWKPISKPIAVQGNLVNFYNGKNQP